MDAQHYLDALLKLPQLTGATVSRDGKWAAWTWMNTAPTFEVYIAPTDGSQQPIRMTNTDQNAMFAGFTRDNRSILITQDKDGNEREQVFMLDLDRPLEMQALTEDDPNYFLRRVQLHQGGKTLVYGANVNEEGEEIEPTWIYRHDLETGVRTPIAKPEKPGRQWPELSEDGQYVLYSRMDRHPAGQQMWLVRLDGSDDREILNFGDDVKTSAAWFPDSRRILVETETPTYRRIGIWEMGNAPNDVRWLVDDPTRNIEYAWVPHNGEQAILYEIEDTYVRCSLLNPDDGSEFQLPKLPGNLSLVGPVGEREWIAVYSNSRQPVDLVRFSLDDITPDRFTSIARVWDQTELTPEDLTRAEDYRWNSRDGLSIQGWLYRTAEKPSRGTIVYVHGGPTSHSRDQINPQIQYLVRQGFNVLDPNYRGSTGFNLEFREKIKVDGWGGMEQTDIATGIEKLIADGIAEPGKIGITGTSYGGYSSWCAITHLPRTLVAAAAPICGMTDLVVDYETTRPDLRPYSEEMMGGSPQDVPEKYKARSPIHFVQNIEGRLLIVQGMRDPNVTPENVSEVTRALQANGIEYELLAFEDEGHGISRRANRKKLYQELLTFFSDAFDLAD